MSIFPQGRIRVFCLCLLLCVAGLSQLQAQQTGTISGIVTDQTGKGIPGANVELRSDRGPSRMLTTNEDGKFSATDVAAGTYTVVAASAGFALATRQGAQVNPGATL